MGTDVGRAACTIMCCPFPPPMGPTALLSLGNRKGRAGPPRGRAGSGWEACMLRRGVCLLEKTNGRLVPAGDDPSHRFQGSERAPAQKQEQRRFILFLSNVH